MDIEELAELAIVRPLAGAGIEITYPFLVKILLGSPPRGGGN